MHISSENFEALARFFTPWYAIFRIGFALPQAAVLTFYFQGYPGRAPIALLPCCLVAAPTETLTQSPL